MSLTVAVPPGVSSGGGLSLLADPGVGAGSMFVTGLVVYLLAYLNVVEASERDRRWLRWLLVAMIIPLATAFLGILVFETLETLGRL